MKFATSLFGVSRTMIHCELLYVDDCALMGFIKVLLDHRLIGA